MAEQYGVSKAEETLLRQQAVQRADRRATFLKELGNPYRHAEANTGHGHIFDPSVQRYLSMQAKKYDYFKPTTRTARLGIVTLLPFFLFGYLIHWDRSTREAKMRRGLVAYRDRKFKFV